MKKEWIYLPASIGIACLVAAKFIGVMGSLWYTVLFGCFLLLQGVSGVLLIIFLKYDIGIHKEGVMILLGTIFFLFSGSNK